MEYFTLLLLEVWAANHSIKTQGDVEADTLEVSLSFTALGFQRQLELR